MKKVAKAQENGAKAVQATCREFKTRAPAWISKAVTEYYTIKKKDITEAKKGASVVGKTKVVGVAVDKVVINYKGRVLTPTHFRMTPKERPAAGRKYKIKTTIRKGQKKTLGPRAFLGGTGGTNQIPFQRVSDSRLPIKAIKTLSVPQMLTNEEVAKKINENIDEGMAKRLEHHLQRMQRKTK